MTVRPEQSGHPAARAAGVVVAVVLVAVVLVAGVLVAVVVVLMAKARRGRRPCIPVGSTTLLRSREKRLMGLRSRSRGAAAPGR